MNRPEQALHFAVADYLRVALPDHARFLHIPMYAPTKAIGGINKRMGSSPGWPDLLIFAHPGEPPIGIELKAGRNTLSDDQEALHHWAASMGYRWFVCRSVEDVERVLRKCGVTLRARATNDA